jgi:hypothetical protein
MEFIGMILTSLICLSALFFLGYKFPKIETNKKLPLLVICFMIAVTNGIAFLVLLGLTLNS